MDCILESFSTVLAVKGGRLTISSAHRVDIVNHMVSQIRSLMYALSIPSTHLQYPGWVTNAIQPPRESKVAASFGDLAIDNLYQEHRAYHKRRAYQYRC